MTIFFTARLAPHFAGTDEVLFEVITPDCERVASTTDERAARSLAQSLNRELEQWADRTGPDAVIAEA